MKSRFSPPAQLTLIVVLLFSSIAAAPYQQALQTPMEDLLDSLGGYECFEGSAFTCVTINVPLDHFNPSDTRALDVTFAVLPAAGARKGMFVSATGGPGNSGITSADNYLPEVARLCAKYGTPSSTTSAACCTPAIRLAPLPPARSINETRAAKRPSRKRR